MAVADSRLMNGARLDSGLLLVAVACRSAQWVSMLSSLIASLVPGVRSA